MRILFKKIASSFVEVDKHEALLGMILHCLSKKKDRKNEDPLFCGYAKDPIARS